MLKVLMVGLALGLSALASCGGDDEQGSNSASSSGQDHAGHTSSTTSGSGAGGNGMGGSGAGGELPALPPIMKGVEPMDGVLHVTWENVTPDCDQIQLDRKQDEGPYATEYTLAGAADSQHDTEATNAGSTYCYKARCKKGSETSADSNEKCGSP